MTSDIAALVPKDAPKLSISSLCLGTRANHQLPSKIRKAGLRWYQSAAAVCSNFIPLQDHPFALFNPENSPSYASIRDTNVSARPSPAPTQDQLSWSESRHLGAARDGVRIGYEPLAWGTMVDNWAQVWMLSTYHEPVLKTRCVTCDTMAFLVRTLLTTTTIVAVLTVLYTYPNTTSLITAPLRFSTTSRQILPVPSQTFVINLPRRQDRRDDMERLRMGLGLGQWSYFSAEDSRSTTVGQILQTVSALREDAFKAYGFETSGNTSTNATIKLPFAWPTSQERNPPDEEDVFAFSDTDPDPPLTCATEDFTIQPYSSELKEYRILTRNRIACWRSHYSVLMQAVSQQTGWSSPVTLILEDDVDMELDIRARLGAVWGSLPPDWDVVFLGHCWSNESYYPAIPILHKEHNTLSRLHPSNAPLCTHGYAVSPAGASRLLVHLTHPPFAYSRAIDHALAWLVQSGRIQAYSVVPSVVVQRKIGSSDVMPDGRGSAWRESLTKGFFDVENLADPST